MDVSTRVRTAVRIRPAESVPDLVEPIMAAVAAEEAVPARTARRELRARRPQNDRSAWRRPVAAAVAGIVVGSLAVGGPWRSAEDQPVAIATVAANVRAAAESLDAYSATYGIVERGLSDDVPERMFRVDVDFLQPQRFRMEVRDRTVYPSEAWAPTDLTYIENAPASFSSGPEPCVLTIETCPTWRADVETSSSFSAAAPLPADLIVPLATFGSTEGIRVVGTGPLEGQDAVHVVLRYDRAAPLFPFLRIGGTWRPFFGGDRVDLWLDASTWFPLRYTVTPSEGALRRQWEMRFGRSPETGDLPILEVETIAVRDQPPDASRFSIPGIDDQRVPFDSIEERIGFLPVTPAETGGLTFVSASAPGSADDAAPRSLLVYARGLDYLRIAEHDSWAGPEPFGPVPADAEVVDLVGGVGRFQAAANGFGNRVAIHGDETDVYLESNLPRDELLAIAASLPIRGLPLPAEAG